MPKAIQLAIPEPCHENWQEMTPQEKGRFCGSCQKTVVDFTGMNDAQVLAYFRKPSTGSVCGRFNNEQLDRDYLLPRKRIPWVKYFFQVALPAFLFSMKSSAQGKVMVIADTLQNPVDSMVKGQVEQPDPKQALQKVIEGKVTDHSGNPVPSASVIVKGTSQAVAANMEGDFRLMVSEDVQELQLQISCVGMETKDVKVLLNSKETKIDISLLQMNNLSSGEVVVMVGLLIRKPKRVKEVPILKSPTMDSLSSQLKLYPNPIVSGSNINLEFGKLKEGYYQIDITGISGAIVFQQKIWIDEEARVLNVKLPSLKAGNYYLSLLDKQSRKRLTQSLVIQ